MAKENDAPVVVEDFDVIEDVHPVQSSMEKFVAVADVQKAFGEPVHRGETLIIPTAEVVSSMGFGLGAGGDGNNNQGLGGGGGGHTFSRPVAVVIASEAGVRVEPVIDVTKVALAFFTAFGFIVTTMAKMRRGKIE